MSASMSRGAVAGALAVLLGLPAAWAAGVAAAGHLPFAVLPPAAMVVLALGLLAGRMVGRLPEPVRLRAAAGVVLGALVVGAVAVFPAALPAAGVSGIAALAAEQSEGSSWYWWRDGEFLRHRNAVADVDALLVRLDEARGHAFMTTEHVFAVLDARDPAGLVDGWLGESRPPAARRLGLPERTCGYRENGEPCGRPVRAANAKFCAFHAAAAKRDWNRDWKRGRDKAGNGVRGRKTGPPPALENSGSASGENGSPVSGYSPGLQNGSTGENG